MINLGEAYRKDGASRTGRYRKDEQKMVRVARADKEKTNKKRTMSEGKKVVIGNKNNSRFYEKCKNESYNE